jgi:hypothetical protein
MDLKLKQTSDSVSGQTVVDPKGTIKILLLQQVMVEVYIGETLGS